MSKLEFIKFKKSHKKNKKYDAILYNNKTKKYKIVSFGDLRYQHYKDVTGLGIYIHLNHYDNKRRILYRKRHYKTHFKKYSPSWFSWFYLW